MNTDKPYASGGRSLFSKYMTDKLKKTPSKNTFHS